MTRIYGNRGFVRRMTASAIVCVLAMVLGAFELWRAFAAAPGESGYGYLFALFFVGGGIYGLRQLRDDYSDTVVAVDAGPQGARIALWRPYGMKRIEGPLSALTNWRREVRTPRRNVRVEMLVADHPGHPRPLAFETGRGVVVTEEFRALSAAADPN